MTVRAQADGTPRARSVLLAATRDLYRNSLVLVPIATAIGVLAVLALRLAQVHPALLLVGAACGPCVSWLCACAAAVVRDGDVSWSQARAMRHGHLARGAVLGGCGALVSGALVLNVAAELRTGSLAIAGMLVLSGWLALAVGVVLLPLWPASAAYPELGLRTVAARTLATIASAPRAHLAVALLLAVACLLATPLVAPLLTLAPALVALVGARLVVPARTMAMP